MCCCNWLWLCWRCPDYFYTCCRIHACDRWRSRREAKRQRRKQQLETIKRFGMGRQGLEMDTMRTSRVKKTPAAEEEEKFAGYWRVSPGTRIPDCQWIDEIIQMAMNTLPDNFPEFLENGVCELLIDRNDGSITHIPCTRGQPGVHVTDRPSPRRRFNIDSGSPVDDPEQELPQNKPDWVFAWKNGHLMNPDDYFHCRVFWYYTANGNMLERGYPNELDGPPPGRTQIPFIAIVQEMRKDLGLSKLGFVRNTDGADVNDSDNELVDESSDGTRHFRLHPTKRDTELYPNSWLRSQGIDRGYMVNHFREETDGPEASKLAVTSEGIAEPSLRGRPECGEFPPVGQKSPKSPNLQTDARPENAPPKHEPTTQLAGSTPAVAWYRKNVEHHRLTASAAAQGASLENPSHTTEPKTTGTNDSAQIRPRLWNPRHFIANIRSGNSSTLAGRNSSTMAPFGVSNQVQETSSMSQGSCALITESESSVQVPPPVASSIPNASSPTAQRRRRTLTEVREEGRMPFIGRVEVQEQGSPGDIQGTLGLGKYQPISCDEKELKQIWLKIMLEDSAANVREDMLADGWLEGAVTESSIESAPRSPVQIKATSFCHSPTDAVGRLVAYTKRCRERVQQVRDHMDTGSRLKQLGVIGEDTASAGEDRRDLWADYIDNSTSIQQEWMQCLKTKDETEDEVPRPMCMVDTAPEDNVEAEGGQVYNKSSENSEEVLAGDEELHFDEEIEGMEEKCGSKGDGYDGSHDKERVGDDSIREGEEEGKTWRPWLRGGAGPDEAALDEDDREREVLRLLWVEMGHRLAVMEQRRLTGLATHEINRLEPMFPITVADGWESSPEEHCPIPLTSPTGTPTAVGLFSTVSTQLTVSAPTFENSSGRLVRRSLNVPAQGIQQTTSLGVEEGETYQFQAHSTTTITTVTGGADGGNHSRSASVPSGLRTNIANLHHARRRLPIRTLRQPQTTPSNSLVGDESPTISRVNSHGDISSVNGRVPQENLRWLRTDIPQTPWGSMVSAFEDAMATGQVGENSEEAVWRQQAGDSGNMQSMDEILQNAERVVQEVTSSYYQDPTVGRGVREWLDRCQHEHRRRVEREVSLLRLRPRGLATEEYQQILRERADRWAYLYRLVSMAPRPHPLLTPIVKDIDEEVGRTLLADAERETPLTLMPNYQRHEFSPRGTLDGVIEGFEDEVGNSDVSMISPHTDWVTVSEGEADGSHGAEGAEQEESESEGSANEESGGEGSNNEYVELLAVGEEGDDWQTDWTAVTKDWTDVTGQSTLRGQWKFR
ncbi:hypothetical protein EV426DRAFT_571437 [Tirmania nivea]|nr:hypothetical protein EV426DRAFT_571437 [Tirmania nivea]